MSHLAFDTETTLVDLRTKIPELVLATASDGVRTVVIHPTQLSEFMWAHKTYMWVGFNWAFDFWVVQKALETAAVGGDDRWWIIADRGQLHDAMLLDMLIRLARGFKDDGDGMYPRNLDEVAFEYAKVRVPKDNPYRTRFGELIGADWGTVDQGFFEYASHDALATWKVWEPMVREARVRIRGSKLRVSDQAGMIYPDDGGYDIVADAQKRYGWLTEGIQTKVSIALADITRRGIGVNLPYARELEAKFRGKITDLIHVLYTLLPKVWQKYVKTGEFKTGGKSDLPKMNTAAVVEYLTELETQLGVKAPRSPKTKRISLSLPVWRGIAPDDPVIRVWGELTDDAKHLQFLVGLTEPRVHARYSTLVRTGRTSSYDPNIQQQPREGWFRQVYIPSPGYKLVAVDYSAIELRTLARTCEAKFGYSRLGEVIREGVDPHAYTASMILGVDREEFLTWKNSPDFEKQTQFKFYRQAAKAVNFGVPGGLGAPKLQAYAKASYGVSLTLEQTQEFRTKLVTEVYPELELYLDSDPLALLAHKLHTDKRTLQLQLQEWEPRMLEKVVQGNPFTNKGRAYNPEFIKRVWKLLRTYEKSGDARIRDLVREEANGFELYARLFSTNTATLTGRIRGEARYTAALNTPFQGLAADGAKLALWRLCREGFRVVAFVHDEVVAEVKDEAEAGRVARILVEEMGRVLDGFPVEVEYKVSEYWSKP